MNILLTGGTGFIGGYVARRLRRAGHALHLVVRAPSAKPLGAEHVHDGTTEGLAAIVLAVAPDVVVHLASKFVVRHQPVDVAPLVISNVLFGAQLLDAMQRAGVSRLVAAATSWQQFESRPYSPVNLYAATKQAFEAVAQYYVEALGFTTTFLALFDTYGPSDPRRKLLPLLLDATRTGKPIDVSPGDQLLDFVHVEDVAAAYEVAVRRQYDGQARGFERFAVSSGAPVSLRDLVLLLARVARSAPAARLGVMPYRPREVMVPWNTGVPLPGWAPSISLENGLSELVAGHV